MNKKFDTEQFVPIPDSDQLNTITGSGGKNLAQLAELLNVRLELQNKGMILAGDKTDVGLAISFLEQIQTSLETSPLLNFGDLKRAFNMLSANRNLDLSDVFKEQKLRGKKAGFYPKTENQRIYIEAIKSYDLVFGVGPAGTGKTYLAMAMAVTALLEKKVKKIVLTRPAVEAGEKLGFLPGDLTEKINPYLQPLYDALYELTSFSQGNELIAKGAIEVAPLAFMRGRTFNDCFIILDEAQNTTAGQMKMVLTRLGFGSKCLITGDVSQIDLPSVRDSGMVQAIKILKNVDKIAIVHLNENDVVRHPLVAAVINAYSKYENKA